MIRQHIHDQEVEKSLFWREARCENCGALIQQENILLGWTRTKCYKCNHINLVMYFVPFKMVLRVYNQEKRLFAKYGNELVQKSLAEEAEQSEKSPNNQ